MAVEPARGGFWRGLDRPALSRGYGLRAMVPDHPAYFAAYEADSAAAYESVEVVRDLVYGDHPRQRADVFQATGGDRPCLVFLHGGFWQAFSKDAFAFVAPAYVRAGISVVTFSYALCPEVPLGTIVAQIREGLIWLAHRGRDYGIDTGRIHVSGHSAGAHLAAMAALTDWSRHDLPAGLVRSVVALSGIFDLRPLVGIEVNDALGLDDETATQLSPILHLDTAPRPIPALFAAGDREGDQMLGQQRAMADQWRARGWPMEAEELPGVHHFDIVQRFAAEGDPLFTRVRDRVLA